MSQGRSNVYKLKDVINVKDPVFGAKGDGTTDDTAAIQAAMTYAVSNVVTAHVPDGNYKLTAAITIPQNANGFGFVGESLKGTVFTQATDNTPAFSWPGGNSSNFRFGLFSIQYANAQPAANTGARAIDFTVTSSALSASNGIYNSEFLALRIVDACRGLYAGSIADGETYDTTSWGLKFGLLIFEGLSGGHIRFRGASPNNRIEGPVYAISPAAGTEELFYLQNQDCLYIGNLEINVNNTNRTALRLDQTRGVIDCFKQEIGTYTTASSALIEHSNAWVTIGEIRFYNNTINVGANKFFLFKNGSTTGHIAVEHITCDGNTLTTGTPLIWNTGSATNRLTIRRAPDIDIFNLSDVGSSAAADGLYVDEWNLPIVSADNGDGGAAPTAASPMVQRFNTTLTANRTITLPNEFGGAGNVSDLFDGKKFKVLRDAATPGAFTLAIVANGALYTIPANTKMAVEYTYKRLSWVRTQEDTLT